MKKKYKATQAARREISQPMRELTDAVGQKAEASK